MKAIRFNAVLTAILCASPLISTTAFAAAAVWDGAPLTFSKAASADWTLAANQDRITNNVWLTRATTQGLFNIVTEPFYTHNSSPLDTAWAFGTTATYSSLTYTNWETWASNNPPATVGQNAVVHLLTDDIYFDLKFDSWGGSGGALSYTRSTPSAAPEPATCGLLGMGALLLSLRRKRPARAA